MAKRYRGDDDDDRVVEKVVVNVRQENHGCFGGCSSLIGIIFLAFFGVIVLICMAGRPNHNGGAPPGPQDPSPSAPVVGPMVTPPHPDIGRTVTIERPGGAGNAHLCVDEEAFNQLMRANSTKSLGEFIRLRESERLLIVVNGVRATVLDVKPGRTMVRLDSGYYQGSSGWVESRYVHPAGPEPKLVTPGFSLKAERLMEEAKALERQTKRDSAMRLYRQVVAGFPGTEQAEHAAGRIKYLEDTGKDVKLFEGDSQYDLMQREAEAEKAKQAEAREKRALALRKIGRNLERQGKTAAALDTYRRIVKDYPGTEAAKDVAGQVEALSGK